MAKQNPPRSDTVTLHELAQAFRETQGEQEARLDYFVHGPEYDEILGDPSKPRASYVFGAAGSGKTSYRRLVAQNYRPHERESQVLGVNYLEPRIVHEIFSAALSGATMELHWKLLFQTILTVLLREFFINREPLQELGALRRGLLFRLFQTYLPVLQDPLALADYANAWGYAELARAIERNDTPSDAAGRARIELIQELRTPSTYELPAAPINQLIRLMDTLASLGIAQVCVTIDGLDEFVEEGNWEAAARFLLPLCQNLAMLQKHALVFKFFLPQSLVGLLEEEDISLEPRYALEWTDEQLGQLLQRRLLIASDGKVVALKEFAQDAPPAPAPSKPKGSVTSPEKQRDSGEDGAKEKQPLTKRLDDELIENAYGSPRRLLRLCQLLFEAPRHRQPQGDWLFTEEDLEWTLRQYEARFGLLVPVMTIDPARKRVLLGARPVKLSASDFKCLAFLAEADRKLQSRDELWKAVWGVDKPVTEEAIDTFISRLRKKIERDPRKPVYLILERGKGYRLENFRLLKG